MSENILEVKNLITEFKLRDGNLRAVNDVSFNIKKGKTLCVVGESGCGKSVTSMSIMRIVSRPGKVIGGEILFQGKDLIKLTKDEMLGIRGNKISMIFQEPMTSLNPVFKVGYQIGESLKLHKNLSKTDARTEAIRLLELVKIPRAKEVVDEYPHQLSGGMRQRVMIAMALACDPEILIADEPTTALDVTIQAQILDIMNEIKERLGTSILFITHDLGVVAEMADDIIVMYAGKVVEQGTKRDVFKKTSHPYTLGLLNSKPAMDEERTRLDAIPGSVPNPMDLPVGCSFAPRCSYATDKCRKEFPELIEVDNEHLVRCFYPVSEVTS